MAHAFLVGEPEELSGLTRLLLDLGHQVSAQAPDPGSFGQQPAAMAASASTVETIDQSAVTLASAATLATLARRLDREPGARIGHSIGRRQTEFATSRREQIERMKGRNQAYARDERLSFPGGWTAGIIEGVVALSVFLNDGAEVTIGFLGPGDFLLPHPLDSCRVEAVAQADLHVKLIPLDEVTAEPAFISAICARVLRAEAWAAAVAHTYVEQRLRRILELLGQQLGTREGGWLKLGIRITHTQLASIIGSTRPTVSRLVQKFEQEGFIKLAGTGGGRRLLIAQPSP